MSRDAGRAAAADHGRFSQADGAAATAPVEAYRGAIPGPGIHLPAPELEGGIEWFNTSKPIHLSNLRGKFVLLDFWTYCCINCLHLLPELKKLEQAYPNNVVVIGVHSGKFDTEHNSESIRQAIERCEIEHPVVNDADYKIWKSYGCIAWPSLRGIDPDGNVVAFHAGEIDFQTLDLFFKENIPKYRALGHLDERPFHFQPEKKTTSSTPLRYPGKVLADPVSNRLFISDSGHNRIVVTSMDGKVLSKIGDGSIGKTDGNFAIATFNHPQGLSLAGEMLYVADTENHLLRKVDLKNQRVITIAGNGEEARPDSQVAEATKRFNARPLATALSSPWALCVHGEKLYIAMTGAHQIWEMPLDETRIGPFAGNGIEDIVNGPLLPRRSNLLRSSSFAQPSGLTSDGKLLYTADSEGSSVRAVPFNPTSVVSTIVGTPGLEPTVRLFTFGDVDGPPLNARLQHCMDLAYDDGQIYVADTYNHKIKAIDVKTRLCRTVAGNGKPGL